MEVDGYWHGLLANAGVIAAFMALRAQLEIASDKWRPHYNTALTTALFIGGTVVLMMLPFEIQPAFGLTFAAHLLFWLAF